MKNNNNHEVVIINVRYKRRKKKKNKSEINTLTSISILFAFYNIYYCECILNLKFLFETIDQVVLFFYFIKLCVKIMTRSENTKNDFSSANINTFHLNKKKIIIMRTMNDI